jgi:hypothetical protein
MILFLEIGVSLRNEKIASIRPTWAKRYDREGDRSKSIEIKPRRSGGEAVVF